MEHITTCYKKKKDTNYLKIFFSVVPSIKYVPL